MALARQQSVFTYSSSSGGQVYLFDVVVDGQLLVQARNFRTPYGLIDALTGLPRQVIQDVEDATEEVGVLVGGVQVESGNASFNGVTSVAVTIADGILNNTNYVVKLTTSDGVQLRITSKTTTGFTIEAASTYGTEEVPITVGYSVLVAAGQSSAYRGSLTFEFADGGAKSVTFASAMPTATYQVGLFPAGFYQAALTAKSKTGFTVTLGHGLADDGSTAVVAYEVFV